MEGQWYRVINPNPVDAPSARVSLPHVMPALHGQLYKHVAQQLNCRGPHENEILKTPGSLFLHFIIIIAIARTGSC